MVEHRSNLNSRPDDRYILSYESVPVAMDPQESKIEPMSVVAMVWGLVPLPFIPGICALVAGINATRNMRCRGTYGLAGAIIGILLGVLNISIFISLVLR